MPLPFLHCDVVLAGPVPFASLGKGFPASHSFHEPLEPRLDVDLDINWNLASLDAWLPILFDEIVQQRRCYSTSMKFEVC